MNCQCDEGLVCFQRNRGEAVPGCLDGESEMSQTDFCIMASSEEGISGNTTSLAPTSAPTLEPTTAPTEMPLVALMEEEEEEEGVGDMPEAEFVGNNGDLTDKLQLCESDCDIDEDCADGLICYQREQDQPIPGCLGEDSSRNDYCILATDVGSTTSTAPSLSPIGVEAPAVTANTTTEDGNDFGDDEDITTTSPTAATTSNGGQATVSMTSSPTALATSNGGQATVSMTSSPTALATNFAALPTKFPIMSPTPVPSAVATVATNFAALPTKFPTAPPTTGPTDAQTGTPTVAPTISPTGVPTESPTGAPTKSPTVSPTPNPTKTPSSSPTESPTTVPTVSPIASPTKAPTVPPTAPPSAPEEDSDFPVEDEETMDDGLPEAVLVGNNNDPAFFPLGKCEGDCDSNDECAEGLICFQRRNEEAIPGCSTPDSELYGIDFCVDPADLSEGEASTSNTMITTTGALVVSSSVNTSTKPARTKPTVVQVQVLPTLELFANNEAERLGNCQGDCDSDDDCLPGLVCFERNDRREVPGCSTTGIYGADYCIKDPNASAAVPVEELPTSSPTLESTSGATSMQTSLGSI